MRIAQLHDGTQIHLPDHVQDHEMDQIVQRHMGAGQPPAPDPAQMMMQLMGDHLRTLAASKGISPDAVQEQRDANMLHHKTSVVTAAAHHDTMREVGGQLAEHIAGVGAHVHEGIAALAEPLAQLAQNSGRVDDLIKSINNLSSTVLEATKAIIVALHMPKEIYTGPDGKPKGVKTKGK